MIQVNGVWLPQDDEIADFVRRNTFQGLGTYQFHKLSAAMEHVKDHRTAVDVGAHCGLWSMWLAKVFREVHAFEPLEKHRECLVKNAPTVTVHPYALGSKEATVRLREGVATSGDTHVHPDGEHVAEVKRLDSFELQNVDFVKIDAEGYELFILEGGENLIRQQRPTLIVEQKRGKAKQYGLGDTDAVKWLEERGYKVQRVMAGDYILTA